MIYLGWAQAHIGFTTSPGYFNVQSGLRVDCRLRGSNGKEEHCFSGMFFMLSKAEAIKAD